MAVQLPREEPDQPIVPGPVCPSLLALIVRSVPCRLVTRPLFLSLSLSPFHDHKIRRLFNFPPFFFRFRFSILLFLVKNCGPVDLNKETL
jgi:hypothetical protein